MSNHEDLNLDDIVAKIKPLLRAGTANTLEVGKWLLIAQKKLDGTGVTFKRFCAKNFPHYKQPTLDMYKRMADNLEKVQAHHPSIRDEILVMSILKADQHLAAALRRVDRAFNKHARKDKRDASAAKANTNNKSKFADINKFQKGTGTDNGADLVDEALETFDRVIKVAKEIAFSRNEKERNHAIETAIKYFRGQIKFDQLPKYKRQSAKPPHVKDAPNLAAA